ncbi:MAG: hypothetical protein ACP5UT_00580 [Bryobacteraceae bacterium]
MLALWVALAAPPAVAAGGAPLYARCDPSSEVIAHLEAGTPVKLGYSIAGEHGRCFQATAGALQGYLFSSALTTVEEYERARADASASDLPVILKAEIRRVREEAPRDPLLAPVLEALESGRPAEALRRIESELLPRAPDEPSLLALAGLAAFQADDTRKAETYWARSLEQRPNPQISALLARVRAERAADAGHERTAASRFVLRYDGRALPGRAADALLDVLNAELNRIQEAIGCPAAEPIHVIVQMRETYHAATGLGEWNGGLFDGRVRVPLSAGARPSDLRQALSHELVHACLARRGVRERWLQEGLAMRLSGERPPPEWIREAQRLDRMPEWDESKPEKIRLFYAWAWLAVEHLFATRGEAGVRELLRMPAALPEPAIR